MADNTSAEVSGLATVTSIAPLEVEVDGATVACPAAVLDDATYSLGDRVTVSIRNPLPPLIQGVETIDEGA